MTSLRQRMLQDMQVRNFSPHTQASYLQQISQFARHFQTSPEALGPDEIRLYQVHLVQERELSISSVCTAVAALRFLYKVTLQKEWTLEDVNFDAVAASTASQPGVREYLDDSAGVSGTGMARPPDSGGSAGSVATEMVARQPVRHVHARHAGTAAARTGSLSLYFAEILTFARLGPCWCARRRK
jgi:Phage integrase, N-terminal SAM-like domain